MLHKSNRIDSLFTYDLVCAWILSQYLKPPLGIVFKHLENEESRHVMMLVYESTAAIPNQSVLTNNVVEVKEESVMVSMVVT